MHHIMWLCSLKCQCTSSHTKQLKFIYLTSHLKYNQYIRLPLLLYIYLVCQRIFLCSVDLASTENPLSFTVFLVFHIYSCTEQHNPLKEQVEHAAAVLPPSIKGWRSPHPVLLSIPLYKWHGTPNKMVQRSLPSPITSITASETHRAVSH